MTIETEVQNLTTATTDLLNTVNVGKRHLDNARANAGTAADRAYVFSNLASEKAVEAQASADRAETLANLILMRI